MLRKATCLVLLLVLMCAIYSTTSAADDRFKLITSNDQFSVYYDTKTVKYSNSASSGKIVDVWIKYQFTEAAAKESAKTFSKTYPEDDWTNFSYIINHMLFNSTNQVRRLSTIFYDQSGNLIENAKSSSSDWQDIAPDTIGESMYNTFRSYLQ